jgi:hypothetical protein
MEIQKQLHKKWWDRLSELADIQTADPALERKGKLLALYIVLLFGLATHMLLNNLFVLSMFKSPEYKIYLIQDIIIFIPLYIFWKLNQKGHVTLTAYISISFSILAASFGSDPKFMEYLMVVFSLPIGISSFVIRPGSSFLFATLTAAAYTASSILTGYIWEYNLTAIIALFCLSFMTWAIANQLENTLQKNNALVNTLRREIYGMPTKLHSKVGHTHWKSATAKHRDTPSVSPTWSDALPFEWDLPKNNSSTFTEAHCCTTLANSAFPMKFYTSPGRSLRRK